MSKIHIPLDLNTFDDHCVDHVMTMDIQRRAAGAATILDLLIRASYYIQVNRHLGESSNIFESKDV